MILTADFVKSYRAMKETEKFVAERRLSDKESVQYDRFTPRNWFNRLPIIPQEETPPKSGFGYTQSPYISQWTKLWGVNPLTDLPKYRMMYRTVPIVKKAIDKSVATAISKGFEIDLPKDTPNREEILDYLRDWISQQEDFKVHLQMLASDALVYGNAYAEVVYDEIDAVEEKSDDPEFFRVEIPDPHEDYKMGEHGVPYLPTTMYNGDGKYISVKAKGNPVWLKPLDPLWMRVRRDSYGNVYGYLQYLSTPPVAFTNEKVMHIRFNAKSWWTENAYGTSALMALVRTQEAIWTIENDLILISHACAKPPLIFACGKNPDGSIDEPWTEGQLTQFVSETNGRGPGGDIYHRGDVESKPLPFPASSLAPLLAHLDYHVEQRMILLGVPPDLLGIHASSNRSTAMVTFDDWINTIQLLQQQLGDAIEEQLFKVIIEKQFGEGTPVPRMVWNQVYEKDHSAEVNKIMSLRAANIISTNEARSWLTEIGKKLEPVTGGDTLLPPQAQIPKEDVPPTEVKEEEKPKEEDTMLASMNAEYTDVEKKKPYIYMPKKEEDELTSSLIASNGGDFTELGTPSSTGQPDQMMYPLLKQMDRRKKTKIRRKAKDEIPCSNETVGKSNPDLRTEVGRVESGGNKDLTNVKVKHLMDVEGISVWIVAGDKVASRYDMDWKNTSKPSQHDYVGGHHLVFDFIPEGEVWVNDLDTEPEKTALHELVEYKLMRDDGYNYAQAHIEALKAEGCVDESEMQKRKYIEPKEVKKILNMGFPNITEKENEWGLNGKRIVFDEIKGIIYLWEDDKIRDQVLVRSSEDIDKFIKKYKTDEDRKDII